MFLFSLLISEPVYRTHFGSRIPLRENKTKWLRSFSTTKNGRNFECFEKNSTISINKEVAYSHMEEKLKGTCRVFTHTGHWYYQFCPFDGITQYRYNNGEKIDVFNIGKFENNKFTEKNNGISMFLSNGDTCKVTNSPRKAEINFICDMSYDDEGDIASISETQFCDYKINYHTQYACAFSDKREEVHDIYCVSKDSE